MCLLSMLSFAQRQWAANHVPEDAQGIFITDFLGIAAPKVIGNQLLQMGKTVVDLIRDNEIRTIRNPWKLILRKSL